MAQGKDYGPEPVFSYIALGSNLASDRGGPEVTVRAALAALRRLGHAVSAESRLFRTPCFPAGAGPDYVNAVARIEGGPEPRTLLKALHALEADFGRERRQRWGNRTLDLDLLDSGGAILPDAATVRRWIDLGAEAQRRVAPDRLILPHPRLHERAFVLVPLCDIAPDWRHPVLGRTATELLAALPDGDSAAVVPI